MSELVGVGVGENEGGSVNRVGAGADAKTVEK